MGPWVHFRSTLDFDSKCTKHCTISFFDAHYQIAVDIFILKTTILCLTQRKEKKRKEKKRVTRYSNLFKAESCGAVSSSGSDHKAPMFF